MSENEPSKLRATIDSLRAELAEAVRERDSLRLRLAHAKQDLKSTRRDTRATRARAAPSATPRERRAEIEQPQPKEDTMNLNELTLGEIKEIAALVKGSPCVQREHHAVGKYCIIRSHGAGVFAGTVAQVLHAGGCCEVVFADDARRIWKWKGAFTLSEVSQQGIDKSGSRVACVVPGHTVQQVLEIEPVTVEARKTIEACHE